jgi:hypothetical protein
VAVALPVLPADSAVVSIPVLPVNDAVISIPVLLAAGTTHLRAYLPLVVLIHAHFS